MRPSGQQLEGLFLRSANGGTRPLPVVRALSSRRWLRPVSGWSRRRPSARAKQGVSLLGRHSKISTPASTMSCPSDCLLRHRSDATRCRRSRFPDPVTDPARSPAVRRHQEESRMPTKPVIRLRARQGADSTAACEGPGRELTTRSRQSRSPDQVTGPSRSPAIRRIPRGDLNAGTSPLRGPHTSNPTSF